MKGMHASYGIGFTEHVKSQVHSLCVTAHLEQTGIHIAVNIMVIVAVKFGRQYYGHCGRQIYDHGEFCWKMSHTV
jgi:hypothetical protein